jgi:hypothetical protein
VIATKQPEIAVRVNNPNRSPARIDESDATPTKSGFADLVSDYFPIQRSNIVGIDVEQ